MELNLRVLSCANIPRPEEIIAIDPYIIFNLTFSKKIHKTRVIDNSFDPEWKQDFQIPIDENTSSFGIDISLRSSDAFSEDFEIGSVTGIIEDLKKYEVREESFEINIVDIDKEKRDAESQSKQISPDHLYTPRFIQNTNQSYSNQVEPETESENKDVLNADDTGNSKLNNDQKGTYVKLMFQIAPKYHPPFAKEGTPPRPYEPKVPTSSYRKGNSGYFLPSSFGPPYIPRGMYDRYSYAQRNERPGSYFSFRNSEDANRRPIGKGRDYGQLAQAHHFGRPFDSDKDNFASTDAPLFINSKTNFTRGAFQYTPSSFSRYRSRRKTPETLPNSASTDDQLNKSGFNLKRPRPNEEMKFTPLSPRKTDTSMTSTKSPNSSFNFDFPNYQNYGENLSKFNQTRPSTAPRFESSAHPNSYFDSYLKTIQPKPLSSSPSSSTSSAISTTSSASTYGRNIPKAFNIYNRSSNQQDLNNLNPPKPSLDAYKDDLQRFHEIFKRNQKQKQQFKIDQTTAGNASTIGITPSKAITHSSNKIQKEKAVKAQTPTAKNDQTPQNNNNTQSFDYNNLLKSGFYEDDIESDDTPFNYNYNYYNNNSDDDEDEEDDSDENIYFRRNYYDINGSSNDDTLSDDDDDDDEDDYSGMENVDFNGPIQRQPARNETSYRYYLPNNNNIRKRASSTSPSTNYSYSYQPKYSDDDQSDSDDVIILDPPNFGKEQPKAPKNNNYQTYQSFQPHPQLNSPTSTVRQPNIKTISPVKDNDKPNDENEKKDKKNKKDIRFFFGPPENEDNPSGEIKFVFNNSNNASPPKNDNKSNETNQPNTNSNENAGPIILHYQSRKKGNSKKQGNRDDSPGSN